MSNEIVTKPERDNSSMITMIERVAMDQNVPIERLEKLMDMQERYEDRARADEERYAKKAYFAAMSLCQSELPIVIKTKKNDHTRSTYADLAAIEDQAMPTIHKHGFAVSFQPDGYNANGELRIKWEISHSEGHSREGVAEIPVDGAGAQGKVNKTGTQAFGSTATYGRRYLLCMLFNISTGDDTDGNKPDDRSRPTITEEQQMQIRELLEASETPEAIFLKHFGLGSLSEILSTEFNGAMNQLRQRLNARKDK